MIKIDWERLLTVIFGGFFSHYSVFGFWYFNKEWRWDKPVDDEPWHGCHRVDDNDDKD